MSDIEKRFFNKMVNDYGFDRMGVDMERAYDCFDMMISVFCYGRLDRESLESNRYLKEYSDVPMDVRVIMVDELNRHGLVEKGTYTDTDGLVYNSVYFNNIF